MCYAIQNPNSANYDYGTIGMCLLIIYSTALSVVLILKQPIEIIKEVVEEVVKVDVQTQVTKEEDEEVIEKEEEKTKKEEELLLANYNAKERALALQTAYDERAKLAFEKWQNVSGELHTIQKHGRGGGDYCAFLTRIREEYLETNEKLTRVEAFNALLYSPISE